MATKSHYVGKASEVAPRRQKIVRIGNISLGIFAVDGEYHALLNVCPHRGGPLCQGPQCGTTVDDGDFRIRYDHHDEIVRCAWHGWEFDIRTGQALADSRVRAKTFPISRDGDDLYVHI